MSLELNRIYNMDCLDGMRMIEDKSIDLVLTDPPYGIGNKWVGGVGHGWGKARDEGELRNEWDNLPPTKEYFDEIFRISKNQIIWGGNYFELPKSRCWLVWTKPERDFSLAEAELAWTSFDNVIRVFDGNRSDPNRIHPTQKPLKLMEWCLQRYSDQGELICDPFMGSGTTAEACIRTGRQFIGFEKEKVYFDAAQIRIKKAQEQGKLQSWGLAEA